MGFNTNISIDILKLIEKLWSKIWGLILLCIFEIAFGIWGYSSINCDVSIKICIHVECLLLLATILVWAIHTKRWFQRTGNKVLFIYFGVICLGSLIYFYVYSYFTGTKYDILYVCYWLPIFGIVLLLGVANYYISKKRTDLCVVFMVSNQSRYEQDIMQALIEARNKVEQIDSKIKIVIPPFGIVNSVNECKKYINGFFNQADAIIFASLINSPEGSEFGYSFTRFSSLMSDRYIKKETRDDDEVAILMDESYRCHEWNTLNINTDQISRQLKIAGNLTHLFLMYVSCIYLQKHKYTDAIDVADSLYTFTSTGNQRYDNLVQNLMANSYLTAQYIEEYDNQDYHKAHSILEECVRKLPHMKKTLAYNLSMARIYFYEGNLKRSKQMTKQVKGFSGNSEWYVAINMAFYAIYEKKCKEIVSYYKKMLKMQKQDKKEVDYAIRFLKIELDKTNDITYKMRLCHGLAFLYNYLDENKSKMYLRKVNSYASIDGYRDLETMRELICTSRGKLRVKK